MANGRIRDWCSEARWVAKQQNKGLSCILIGLYCINPVMATVPRLKILNIIQIHLVSSSPIIPGPDGSQHGAGVRSTELPSSEAYCEPSSYRINKSIHITWELVITKTAILQKKFKIHISNQIAPG